jgi:hypothetical protein
LKLTLVSVPINHEDSLQFLLNVGKDPQPGQKWELNKTVNLGGYGLVIDDIVCIDKGYTIHYHASSAVPEDLSFGFFVEGSDSSQSEGTLIQHAHEVDYSETIHYDNTAPAGNLTFLLTLSEIVRLPGPWTLTWSPPVP